MNLGLNIKRLREEQGLTQAELGKRSGGLTQRAISRIENGQRETSRKATVEAIAQGLGVSVAKLYSEGLQMGELLGALNRAVYGLPHRDNKNKKPQASDEDAVALFEALPEDTINILREVFEDPRSRQSFEDLIWLRTQAPEQFRDHILGLISAMRESFGRPNSQS